MSLKDGHVAARIPVKDLDRARAFYSEKLGLEPTGERPGGLRYEFADGEFSLFQSAGAGLRRSHPDGMGGRGLRRHGGGAQARGVSFEEFGFAEVPGHYPSKRARGENAAWFRDVDGNLFGIGQPIR